MKIVKEIFGFSLEALENYFGGLVVPVSIILQESVKIGNFGSETWKDCVPRVGF